MDSYSEQALMLASQNPKKRSGRKTFKETRHPVYRGVRSRDFGKWVCEVRHPISQSRVWLGTHDTADMAARAHDVAVLAMRGKSACLNFADSVWRLPVPKSSNIMDIQKAAAEAAEVFRHTDEALVEIVCDVDELLVEIVCDMDEVLVKIECDVDVDEDEDDILSGMPGYIDSMAEALMLSPPQPVGYGNGLDDVEFCDDMSLWSY